MNMICAHKALQDIQSLPRPTRDRDGLDFAEWIAVCLEEYAQYAGDSQLGDLWAYTWELASAPPLAQRVWLHIIMRCAARLAEDLRCWP